MRGSLSLKLARILLTAAISLTALRASTPAVQAPAGPLDPQALERFVDGYLAAQMPANHIAGATVAVVKDGRTLFVKGYGYADVARRAPVDPERTLFVLGSLSKLFTWTAVMQLVEQGKLDLDADVNAYLDFKIPPTYAQPITLKHLMAHSAGFEDNKFAQMSEAPGPLIPLGTWLKAHLPARVCPPGQVSAYGNHNAALAGYIVERVSGMGFDEYLETRLFGPLGMTHTSSRQPLAIAGLSQGYRFVDGGFQPQAGGLLHAAPAGSVCASAADMARFMIAHLDDGRLGEASLLQPATARLMHQRSFSHDPRVNGFAHGFWELDANGQRIIGHAGSHFIFNSMLMLFPEQRLGVFLATNSDGGNAFVGNNYFAFHQAFVQHCFPREAPRAPVQANPAARFCGSYHVTMGRSETTPEKLFALMAVNMQAGAEGLLVTMPFGKTRFVEVEPRVFRQVDGDHLLVFQEDNTGAITRGFYGPAPVTALVKNRWFEAPAFHLLLLGSCVAVFLSMLVPVGLLIRRPRTPAGPLERAARWIAIVESLLCPLLLIGIVASLFNIPGLMTGQLPWWSFLRGLSVAVALLALSLVASSVLAWKRRWWGLAGRIHHTLAASAAAGFVWFLWFWNLLGKGF